MEISRHSMLIIDPICA